MEILEGQETKTSHRKNIRTKVSLENIGEGQETKNKRIPWKYLTGKKKKTKDPLRILEGQEPKTLHEKKSPWNILDDQKQSSKPNQKITHSDPWTSRSSITYFKDQGAMVTLECYSPQNPRKYRGAKYPHVSILNFKVIRRTLTTIQLFWTLQK